MKCGPRQLRVGRSQETTEQGQTDVCSDASPDRERAERQLVRRAAGCEETVALAADVGALPGHAALVSNKLRVFGLSTVTCVNDESWAAAERRGATHAGAIIPIIRSASD